MTASLVRGLLISFLLAELITAYHGGHIMKDFYRHSDCQRRNIETKLHAKSKTSNNNKKINSNVEKYLHLRELVRLQKDGASYDDLKEASVNGTKAAAGSNGSSGKKASYQRLLGKGNLDQRLRAIISYKRSSIAAESESDEVDDEELLQLMEDESEDDELDADEEEALYESVVLKAIEQKKLDELKSRLLGEQKWDARSDLAKQMRSEAIAAESDAAKLSTTLVSSVITNVGITSTAALVNASQRVTNAAQEDLYTPAVSTWGVFQRPRDISKTYGGGRAITREEMNRMDEQMEREQEVSAGKAKQFLTASMKVEEENKAKIKDALDRGRGYMTLGNRVSAVQILESVKELVSWQSDFGGEVLLELGMALETVDRTDESRQIYGKLVSSSWSQKIRRQATGLISGLDITKQIRKQVYNNSKPVLDYQQMAEISEALAPGLRNTWNEYKKGPRKDANLQPWFDDGKTEISWRVSTLTDAYNIFLREMNPLQKVPSDALMRAFRRFYIAPHTEKFEFMRGKKKPYFITNAYSSLNPKNGQDMKLMINGSWELVTSGFEQAPYLVKHYEAGSVRRFIDVTVPNCKETSLVLWGMSSVTHTVNMDWNGVLHELSFTGDDLRRSSSPWQKPSRKDQVFQVTYADEALMITRQISESLTGPDLYVLWKRMKENIWNKY